MFRDLRLAFRALVKQPGFTAVAVATIALGVGANSAIFSVVDAVMLRPLPFRDAGRVVIVNEHMTAFPSLSLSRENYADVCAQAQSFDGCGAFHSGTFNMSGSGEPRRVQGKLVSAALLPMLGVTPALGRTFTPREDGAGGEHVVMLGYGLWQAQFGQSPNVLGQPLLLDGVPYTIVGVTPASFTLFQQADVFVPLGPFLAAQPDDRSWHPGINVLAHVRDGATLGQANTEVASIAARLEHAYPATNTGVSLGVTRAQDLLVQGVRTALVLLLAAVGGVLLIACINVAGLQLARGLSRRRDMAVRIALGASPGRVVRHLLAESALIGLAGGAAGLLLASFAVPLLLQLVGPTLPRADTVAVDWRVALFTMALALGTTILFGLVPALQSARVDVRDALAEGGRGGAGGGLWQRRARAALVVAEIAVTLVLTIGAALLIRSFARLQQVSPGFDASGALVADLPLSSVRYTQDAVRTSAVDQLLARVGALPGVRAVACTTQLPMAGAGAAFHFNIQGRPAATPDHYALAGYRAVSGGYFPALGIPVMHGRGLTERDREGAPRVVVINDAMAREFFPREDPVGRRLQLGALPEASVPYMEIVGVVGDVRQQPDAEARAEMYVPYDQFPDAFTRRMYTNVSVVVRSGGNPAPLASGLREAARQMDGTQPLANVRTLDAVIAASVSQPRFRTLLLGLFAAIALTLAAIGVYGLLAHGVAQRVNEFAVRMALGASAGDVMALVLRQGLTLALAGVGIGLLASIAAVRALRTVLFDVGPWDPAAWVGSAGTLLVVALLASWVPARRALHSEVRSKQ